jgi:hypothetical protein
MSQPEDLEHDARLGDSSFWFDPHTIPQYDLLVRDGRITAQEAQQLRADRAAAGLPMTFAELQPRPHPAFAWVAATGGPVVTQEQERVNIDGHVWTAWAWDVGRGQHEARGELQLHNAAAEYDARKLSKAPPPNDGVAWEATYQVAEGVYARLRGTEPDFARAHAAVCAVDFSPQHLGGGLDWFTHGGTDGWIAAWEGQALEVRKVDYTIDPASQWRWEISLAESSPLKALAKMFGGYQLQGFAASIDAAIADALGAPTRAQVLAAQLLADDRFEAGRQAGRAELKALIFGL